MKRLLPVALLAAACGNSSTPANVAGSYTVAVTNEGNGCNFQNWQSGNTASNIPVTVTQSGANATAVVGGAAGAYMTAVLGSNAFSGPVNGAQVDLTLYGTRSASQGNCAYTVNATMLATSMGDFLSGTITYTAATNGSPDCGALQGCQSIQDFNGTRPPM